MDNIKEFAPLKSSEKLLDDSKAFVDKVPDFGEFDYFNLFPEFQEIAEDVNKQSLKIVQSIYEYYLPMSTIVLKDNPAIHESTQFSKIELLYDSIFEKMDEAIDMKKGLLIDTEENAAQKTSINRGNAAKENVVTYSSTLDKPQLSFKDRVDNSDAPFQPQLKIKHHSTVDWNIAEVNEDGIYDNPYTYEISNIQYPEWEVTIPEKITHPRPIDETPLKIIDDEESMKELVEALKAEKSIAVDLEHHDYRSYQGFTCLIQISTRTTDYLVDVIKAREHVWSLNEVFADPAIMKVLHGADRDIVWLQKDFGVYVVNMFDSGQAARVLGYESFGLAYLLKRYCGVIANKEYQRADWRLRPLTANMKKYAREDTHYLLYISDELRTQLISQNLLQDVLNRSAELCKQSYQKPVVTIFTGEEVLLKKSLSFNRSQRQVFMILYYWRDQQARKLDESGQFILPIASLIKLAQMQPKSSADLPRLLHPVPPEVRSNSKVLIELIQKGCEAPDMKEETLLAVYNEVCGEGKKENDAQNTKNTTNETKTVFQRDEDEVKPTEVLTKLMHEGANKYPLTYHDLPMPAPSSPACPSLFRPETGSAPSADPTLAELDHQERVKERLLKKQAVDEELNVDEMFRDLAIISGMMDHEDSDEESDEGVTAQTVEAEEEPIRSLKEIYKKKPAEMEEEVISFKRDRSNDIDELLGVHEIELKSDEAMKKAIQWTSKKPKVEKKEAIQPEKMKQFIQSIGASNYMMNEEEVEKTQEMLKSEKKKEKKKVMKKRFKEGRKQPTTM